MLNTSLPSERTEVYPGPSSTSSRISLYWPLDTLKIGQILDVDRSPTGDDRLTFSCADAGGEVTFSL
jgi:hypothetical protein